jgi:hypothetical protein
MLLVTGANLYTAPQLVQDAMASKEAEGPIPIIALTDAKAETLAGVVPYLAMKDERGFLEARTKLSALRGTAAPVAKAEVKHPAETWVSAEGRKTLASFVAQRGENVTLRLSNGRDVTMPLARLSEAGQKRATELASK